MYIFKKKLNSNFKLHIKKGEFKEFNNVPVLVLYDGETIKGGNEGITNFRFSKSDFPLIFE